MAAFAKRLPVVFVPEKTAISAMGNDVVYYGGRSQHSVFQAFRTQGMAGKKSLPCLLPACVVPPCSCAAAKGFLTPLLAMRFAVHAAVAEIGTAGIAAWSFGRMRHMTSCSGSERQFS